jgi:mRNA-degrading endonuclease RelE of RelBE toxin-antitoxin system
MVPLSPFIDAKTMNITEKSAGPEFQPLGRRAQSLFQVTFSDQSMSELNKLGVEEQLRLVDVLSNITPRMLERPVEPIGRFSRDGRTYYRVRAEDFRCYFEVRDGILYAHYILHKNSLTDYVFRNKLPIREEILLEQSPSFWKYLETIAK